MFGDEASHGIVYSTAADPRNGQGEHVPCPRSRLGPVHIVQFTAPTALNVFILRNPAGIEKNISLFVCRNSTAFSLVSAKLI